MLSSHHKYVANQLTSRAKIRKMFPSPGIRMPGLPSSGKTQALIGILQTGNTGEVSMLATPPLQSVSAAAINAANVSSNTNNQEWPPFQSPTIPKFQFEIKKHYQDCPKALTTTLNCFLLNQIGHQTRRYEQQFEALLNGDETYESLVSSQKIAVHWADKLDKDALAQDLQAYEEIANENEVTTEAACAAAHTANLHRMALAEPLVERIRLAYLFVFSNNLEDAQKVIDEAAELDLATPALEVEHIAHASRGIRSLRDIIKLARNTYCVTLLFQECDTNRDGRISRDDIANALKRRDCEVPKAVLAFLLGHFDRICGCESQHQSAITLTNLDKYMKSRWLYGAFKDLLIS